jgi:mono/diheme cytochrome c family protein
MGLRRWPLLLRPLPAAVLGVLAACSAQSPPGTGSQTAAAADVGARIYNGNCIACHQQDAHGIPGVYPSLAGSPVVLGDPRALALWIVKGQRSALMPEGRYATKMPAFGWLDAEHGAALLTFLRSSFGNAAPPVDAATVAAALGN